MRIVDVREIHDVQANPQQASPLLVVLYNQDTDETKRTNGGRPTSSAWLDKLQREGRLFTRWRNVTADFQEQHLLLSLLKTNAAIMDKTYMPAVPRWKEEKNFKLSFLVPCYPLNGAALEQYRTPAECVKCSREATAQCSACGMVYYCSKSTSNDQRLDESGKYSNANSSFLL